MSYTYESYNKVLTGFSNVWVGDINSSQDSSFITNNKISVIINATYDAPVTKFENVTNYRIPLGDSGDPIDVILMEKYLLRSVSLLSKLISVGNNILVHCMAGQQRSATVVAGYICLFHNMDPQATIQYIVKCRPCAFYYGTEPHFLHSLNSLHNKKRISANDSHSL